MDGFSPPETPQGSFSSPTVVFAKAHHNANGVHSSAEIPSRPASRRSSTNPQRRSSRILDPTSSPNIAMESPNEHSSWSSAVGRASIGKSGRVIERLMAENDRLRREIKVEMSRREEIQKREEMTKPVIDSLRAENENLLAMRAADQSVVARRDRKIEELKADLEVERARRVKAEESAAEMGRRRDEAVAACAKELGEAKDVAKHAVLHAEVLERSHEQLGTEYRQRTGTLALGLKQLSEERDDERGKVGRLDLVVDQLRQEIEKQARLNREIRDKFEGYKVEKDAEIQAKMREMDEKEKRDTIVREEMEKVLGEMRWVLGLRRIGKGIDVG